MYETRSYGVRRESIGARQCSTCIAQVQGSSVKAWALWLIGENKKAAKRQSLAAFIFRCLETDQAGMSSLRLKNSATMVQTAPDSR